MYTAKLVPRYFQVDYPQKRGWSCKRVVTTVTAASTIPNPYRQYSLRYRQWSPLYRQWSLLFPTVVSVVPTVSLLSGLQFAVCTSYNFHRFVCHLHWQKPKTCLVCLTDLPLFHSKLDVRFPPPEIGWQPPPSYKKTLYKKPSQHIICILVESVSSGSLCLGNQPTCPLLSLVLLSRVTMYLRI